MNKSIIPIQNMLLSHLNIVQIKHIITNLSINKFNNNIKHNPKSHHIITPWRSCTTEHTSRIVLIASPKVLYKIVLTASSYSTVSVSTPGHTTLIALSAPPLPLPHHWISQCLIRSFPNVVKTVRL